MESIKVMMDFCISILYYKMDLFGYQVSLGSVMVYWIIGVLVLGFFYRIFK